MYGLMLWAVGVPLRWDADLLAWVPDRWAYSMAHIPAGDLAKVSDDPRTFTEKLIEHVNEADERNARALLTGLEVADGWYS